MGGGAIAGIGETFRANAFTGTSALSVPSTTPPCRGFEPHLSLDYSSGAGNGIFGIGFHLEIPNITGKTALAFPMYDDTDIFLFAQADELVPQLANLDGEWAPEIWYRAAAEGGPGTLTQN